MRPQFWISWRVSKSNVTTKSAPGTRGLPRFDLFSTLWLCAIRHPRTTMASASLAKGLRACGCSVGAFGLGGVRRAIGVRLDPPHCAAQAGSASNGGRIVGPLTGIKVVEFAGIGPGPMCAMLLADLGATTGTVKLTVPK